MSRGERVAGVTRRRFLGGLGVGGLAGLAGCAGGLGGSSGPELTATLGADVKSYDPTQMNDTTSTKATGLIYESLMTVDFDGTPRPLLARSIEQRESDRSWRVSLREGVTFHDGSELTAQDVQASFKRYNGSSRESDVYLWYESSTVRDDYTIDVTLKEKYAPFKFSLAAVPIVPRAARTGDLDLTSEPVGTGPFEFDAHEHDSYFRITRFDDHWFGGSDAVPDDPAIDTVTFRIVVEQSAQLAALQSGDVDFINDPPAGSVADLKADDDYRVTERINGGFDLLMFPLETTPYDNRKVRRGISRLVPRQDIVESVYHGIGQPAYAPISPLLSNYTSESFQQRMREEYIGYDPERAAELLSQGFEETGVSAPVETKIITNQNPQRVKWCQLIQQELNATEYFDVSLEKYEWNTYTGKVLTKGSSRLDAMMGLGWSAGWDPDNYVRYLFSSEQFTPNCCNAPHYANDEVDRLLDRAIATYDTAERRRLYEQIQEQVVADSPMTFVRFGMEMDAMRADRVKGFETYPISGSEYAAIYAPLAGVYTRLDGE